VPDTLVLSSDVWTAISTDPNLFGKGSAVVKLALEEFRQLINIPRVLIADAVYTTARQNEAAEYPLSRMWLNNMALFTVSPSDNNLLTPKLGYTFVYNKTDKYSQGQAVRTWETPDPEGDWLEYAQCRGLKLASVNSAGKIIAGALMTKVYASLVA
jgi:hypothetical protein